MCDLAQAHPSERAVEEYVFERLAGQELDQFEEHLLVCELCQDRLVETGEYVAGMKAATGRLQQERPLIISRSRRRRWFEAPAWFPKPAWGAALAVALLTVTIWIPRPAAENCDAEVTLTAMRGPEQTASLAPAGKPFLLKADLTGVAGSGWLKLEIVDLAGRVVWGTSVQGEASALFTAVSRRLDAGQYWVRVTNGEGRLLREYGLEAR